MCKNIHIRSIHWGLKLETSLEHINHGIFTNRLLPRNKNEETISTQYNIISESNWDKHRNLE